MSVVALGAVRSCGVTTLAVALAATWPPTRRALVVEADPAGGTLAAGSGWPPEPGLVSFAAATRRAGGLAALFDHCHRLPGGAPVLAAPPSGEQARHVLALLDGALEGLGALACDVLLDCGRLVSSSTEDLRLMAADRAVIVTRPRLADLHALRTWLSGRGAVPLVASGRLGLVLVGDGPYPDAEVVDALGVEVLAHLPNDPEAADALLALAAEDRTLRRAPLVRAARTLAAQLAGVAQPVETGHLADADHTTDEPAPTPRLRQPRLANFRSRRAESVASSNGHGGTR